MQPGDFIQCTFEGDPQPAVSHALEIIGMDPVGQSIAGRFNDTGAVLVFDYSPGLALPWPGSNDTGSTFGLATHDIYVPENADPVAGDAALLTFADGGRFLVFVDAIDPVIEVQLYHPPWSRLSIDGGVITATDWPLHGVGEQLLSVQHCRLANDIPAAPVFGVFSAGWWSLATRRDAHPGRVGGAIAAFATVVHTTDMAPETWDILLDRWSNEVGPGSCAHFAIGRSAAEGVIQMVPIDRNANHAGGDSHGNFVAGNQSWHPNLVSVGIEIHCAGAVRQIGGEWRYFTEGAAQGLPIPDSDVIPDPRRPGRGWHMVTPYQYEQLAALLDGLEATIDPLPAGCIAQSIEQPPAYGIFPTGRIVGHVSLTASRRGDPWPPTCDWLRAR